MRHSSQVQRLGTLSCLYRSIRPPTLSRSHHYHCSYHHPRPDIIGMSSTLLLPASIVLLYALTRYIQRVKQDVYVLPCPVSITMSPSPLRMHRKRVETYPDNPYNPALQPTGEATWLWGHEKRVFDYESNEMYTKWMIVLGPLYKIKAALFHDDVVSRLHLGAHPRTPDCGFPPPRWGALDLQVGIDMKLSLTFDHLCHASQIVATDHAAVQHIFQYSDKYGECSAAVLGPCSFRMAFCAHRTFDEQRRRALPCRKLSKRLRLTNDPSDLSHHLRSAPIPFGSLGRMRWRYNQMRSLL